MSMVLKTATVNQLIRVEVAERESQAETIQKLCAAMQCKSIFPRAEPVATMPDMLNAAEKVERTRLSVEDWELGALEMIAEEGVAALAVEALARRLGVTKGSFYWHFPNRETLLTAALTRWETVDAADVFAGLDSISDPGQRLRELFRRSARESPNHVIYSALLHALDNPLVQPVVERVAKRRMDFLARAYCQLGLEPRPAAHRARLAYAAYVGFLQLSRQLGTPRLDRDEFEDYVDHVIITLIP